jgi:hypothetical protein
MHDHGLQAAELMNRHVPLGFQLATHSSECLLSASIYHTF